MRPLETVKTDGCCGPACGPESCGCGPSVIPAEDLVAEPARLARARARLRA